MAALGPLRAGAKHFTEGKPACRSQGQPSPPRGPQVLPLHLGASLVRTGLWTPFKRCLDSFRRSTIAQGSASDRVGPRSRAI